jgi:hypothetical protein
LRKIKFIFFFILRRFLRINKFWCFLFLLLIQLTMRI